MVLFAPIVCWLYSCWKRLIEPDISISGSDFAFPFAVDNANTMPVLDMPVLSNINQRIISIRGVRSMQIVLGYFVAKTGGMSD